LARAPDRSDLYAAIRRGAKEHGRAIKADIALCGCPSAFHRKSPTHADVSLTSSSVRKNLRPSSAVPAYGTWFEAVNRLLEDSRNEIVPGNAYL